MKVELIYKKTLSNSKKKIEFDTDNNTSRNRLLLILEHEKNSRIMSSILGEVLDFKDNYKLFAIKADGEYTTISELITKINSEEVTFKISKRMLKRMGKN